MVKFSNTNIQLSQAKNFYLLLFQSIKIWMYQSNMKDMNYESNSGKIWNHEKYEFFAVSWAAFFLERSALGKNENIPWLTASSHSTINIVNMDPVNASY